jgi:hypothetical protein
MGRYDGLVICPHHAVPADWDWMPYRVAGKLLIAYRFPCCDYQLHVSGLPVPGIHSPLPETTRLKP